MYVENNKTPNHPINRDKNVVWIKNWKTVNPRSEISPTVSIFSIKEKSLLLKKAINVKSRKMKKVIPAAAITTVSLPFKNSKRHILERTIDSASVNTPKSMIFHGCMEE